MAKDKPLTPVTSKGFTLIELVIAVTVIGLLSVIAVPAYTSYIRSSHRTDAIKALIEAQQLLENCRTNSTDRTYAGCDALVTSAVIPDYYSIAVTIDTVNTVADMGYTVTATPVGTQTKDTDCASFTINQVSSRTATNSFCWK